MKTIINTIIVILLLITQLAIAQKKSVKGSQLLIKNKITEKSVKIATSENTLKNFGALVRKDTLDQTIEPSSHFIKYTFDNIVFYISTRGTISTFETKSKNIAIEKRGMFSFSPGDHMDSIAAVFPYEVENAKIMHRGRNRIEYLSAKIKLSKFDNTDYADCALVLLFNPETKILEEIFYWIRP